MRRPLAAIITVAVLSLAACSSSASETRTSGGSGTSGDSGSGGTAVVVVADPNDITTLPRPVEGSVEAGFARDMSVHHAQAVAMAEAIRDRTADPDLKLLATDIALGQQGQIGRMSGWLDEWGLNQTSTATPMGWIRSDNLLAGSSDTSTAGMDMGTGMGTDMGGHGDTMVPEADGRMPGMATRPQVTALGTLPIDEAEISFLQLMIVHHTAGVEMAQAALARTSRPDVIRLATSIINGQQAEITVMTDMLAKRGATP